MSFPISKLMSLVSKNEMNDEKLSDKLDSKAMKNEFPDRYKKLRGLMNTSNNDSYSPSDYDQFNVAMKFNSANKGMQDLHLVVKNNIKKPYGFEETESWIDPAQRRRATDPNHAPVFDFNAGSDFQQFTLDENEMKSHNNVSLVQQAHQSYYNYVNRYNFAPPKEGPGLQNIPRTGDVPNAQYIGAPPTYNEAVNSALRDMTNPYEP